MGKFQEELNALDIGEGFYSRRNDICARRTGWANRKLGEHADAKAMKNYVLADSIRNEMLSEGIILEDTKNGPTWRVL